MNDDGQMETRIGVVAQNQWIRFAMQTSPDDDLTCYIDRLM